MKTAIVYGIKNKLTGKYYVGSTRDLETRMCIHKSLLEKKQHSAKLQDARNETDSENWEWLILEDNIPLIHQFHSEQHWIDALDAYHQGYNSSPRAGSYVSIDDRGYRSFIDDREDDLLEILAQIESGTPYRKIASDFGVSLGFLTELKRKHPDLLQDLIKMERRNKQRIEKEKAEAEKRKADRQKRDRKIVEMIDKRHTYREVSRAVGCSLGTVSNVISRKKSGRSPKSPGGKS